MPTKQFCGINFVSTSPGPAVDWLCRSAMSESGGHVHLLNAYSVVMAHSLPDFRLSVSGEAVNFPDGKPISVLAGRHPVRLRQVRGPGLFEMAMDQGRKHSVRHFLLGASPETLDLLRLELLRRFPGVSIVGAISPPFRALSIEERLEQDALIRESGASIVWVGLGTPKQDIEAERLAKSTGKLVVAIGAAFDFSAGTKKTAPEWMGQAGLEWLYRLVQEPRRLWKRYILGNIQFLVIVGLYRMGLKR